MTGRKENFSYLLIELPFTMAGLDERVWRGGVKGTFTRAKTTLEGLITRNTDEAMITAAKDAMVDTFEKLEEANFNYLIKAEIDIDANPDSEDAKIQMDLQRLKLKPCLHMEKLVNSCE